MALIPTKNQVAPSKLKQFLGLNVSETGDTQIKLGESGNMTNFYITDDFKLKKMYGYKSIYDFEDQVKGIYGAKIGTVGYLLVAAGGKLYYFLEGDLEDESIESPVPTEIGDIVDADCSFFEFGDKVYILSGDYYSWDGTTLETVTGYTPLVLINGNPASGTGTEYEDINLLNPQKHMTFNGDGNTTVYHLPSSQTPLESVDKVMVNGETVTNYTVDLNTGTITFGTAPGQAMDNVDIYWSKDDGDRGIITNMKYGTVFGGNTDSRVFLYGNNNFPNKVYFSGLEEGQPSVEYFCGFYQVDIGTSNYSVTDLTRQYDRLLATTNRPDAYYLTIGLEDLNIVLSDSSTVARTVPTVSVFPLNEAHGNFAPGQGQVLNNYPVTIDKTGFTLWKATNVRDEKNAQTISQKIHKELVNLNPRLFKTLERQADNQMWFANGYSIYIYNYANDTYSRIRTTDETRDFCELGNIAYMSTADGKVMKWNKDYITFNGQTIRAHWEMNFSDFGAFYLRKTMRKMWVQMQPSIFSSANIGYITNVMTSPVTKYISYRINDGFGNVDFNDFSFQLSVNPQPFRLKLKAKKFTNMKVTIDNLEDSACTILGLAIKAEGFGESK